LELLTAVKVEITIRLEVLTAENVIEVLTAENVIEVLTAENVEITLRFIDSYSRNC